MIELRKFVIPEIISGENARCLVGKYMRHFGSKRPLIVTDKNVKSQTWFKDILESLEEVTYEIFDEITPNPKDFEAMIGSEYFLAKGCDMIVAIGGGSVMDCAKCISIVSTNGGHILDYEGVDEIRLPGPPLICIPSTAGTSADVSQFAIINDTQNNIKKAIISKKAVPDLALIDPVPLMTMDMYLTACTAMDALTHAIEAYVSNAQSTLTDVNALEAVRTISRHIRDSIKDNRSLETMNFMMNGSLEAGIAFSNASLGAVHATAHALGGLLDLAHGECNSILLEHVVDVNFDAAPKRYRTIAEAMGIDVSDKSIADVKELLIGEISKLRADVGISSTIDIEPISVESIRILSLNALNDPCMVTNPKQLSEAEVREIYERILPIEKKI